MNHPTSLPCLCIPSASRNPSSFRPFYCLPRPPQMGWFGTGTYSTYSHSLHFISPFPLFCPFLRGARWLWFGWTALRAALLLPLPRARRARPGSARTPRTAHARSRCRVLPRYLPLLLLLPNHHLPRFHPTSRLLCLPTRCHFCLPACCCPVYILPSVPTACSTAHIPPTFYIFLPFPSPHAPHAAGSPFCWTPAGMRFPPCRTLLLVLPYLHLPAPRFLCRAVPEGRCRATLPPLPHRYRFCQFTRTALCGTHATLSTYHMRLRVALRVRAMRDTTIARTVARSAPAGMPLPLLCAYARHLLLLRATCHTAYFYYTLPVPHHHRLLLLPAAAHLCLSSCLRAHIHTPTYHAHTAAVLRFTTPARAFLPACRFITIPYSTACRAPLRTRYWLHRSAPACHHYTHHPFLPADGLPYAVALPHYVRGSLLRCCRIPAAATCVAQHALPFAFTTVTRSMDV